MLALALFVLPALAGVGAYYGVQYLDNPVMTEATAERWQKRITEQQAKIESLRQRSEEQLKAQTRKLAEMQARLVRLDALGERLVDVAGINSEEFDFEARPALGGPEMSGEASSQYEPPAFVDTLDQMSTTLTRREQQLEILDGLMKDRQLEQKSALKGRPITDGWMSSRFGYRTDPFTGELAMHEGMDFAGKEGSDIVATASGVVTYADERWGYGNLVEINHGDGLVTRYGHAKTIVVEAGDIVKPGQVIAKMGNSGRSTGPHVHYEVRKDGKPVDPRRYVYRKR
jgi:murein DD-endopeptidase MepM/ murein hydrolase activator NlpD